MKAAKTLRDEALERVEEKAKTWLQLALDELPNYPSKEATGEQIRIWVCSRVGAPHHHNAAGALILRALKLRLIEKTGKMGQMKTRSSHARMTPIYRIR
jgi:hypothetical protein